MDRESFPVLDSGPTLFPDLRWVWDAFHALSLGRQRGFSSAQPIALSEIKAYAEFRYYGDPEDRHELLHFVQFMDKIFLETVEKRKPKSPG